MAGGEWSRAIAVAAFVASYVGLGLGRVPPFRVDRTGVAIIGAAAMVASGALPWPDAVAAVDAPTLVLLFGMMIVTAYLRLSGFFHLVTTWTLRRARTPRGLLAAVIVASGVLSAFFVNDVICLVLAPVVLGATRQLGLPPVPYLIALATAANVGSVATLTGNPQNMLVGSFSGVSYRSFLAREAPVAALGLACVFLVVWLVYRRQLPHSPPEIVPDTRMAIHYPLDRKSTRLNSSHGYISYAVFCLKKKTKMRNRRTSRLKIKTIWMLRYDPIRSIRKTIQIHQRARACFRCSEQSIDHRAFFSSIQI